MTKKPQKTADVSEPFFDLASYIQRDTFQMPLLIPGTDKPLPTMDGTPAWIEHYGFTSTRYDEFLTMMRKKRAEDVRKGVIDEDAPADKMLVRQELVAYMTVGWHLSFAGEYLEFNDVNKKKIFNDENRSFVVSQVYESIHTQVNFIDASAQS